MHELTRVCPRLPAEVLLIAILCVFPPAGCGPVNTVEPFAVAPAGIDRAHVTGVPFFPQEKYQCGPASMAMMLGWSGIDISPAELVPEIYTPALKGGLQSALIASARRHGRLAYPISGMQDLLAEINAGRPVLVLLNLSFSWYPRWHYAVVVGFDRIAGEIHLHSGTREGERMAISVYNNLWARSNFWGLLVLPPSQMPADVDHAAWLEAAVGLEAAEQWQAAETAFRKATERWPQSYGAWIGLGNSLYALHYPGRAAAAFTQAIRINPQEGIAFNNLAQALADAKRYNEALAAAGRAVSLDGPLVDEFRATRAQIEARFRESRDNPGYVE